MADFGERKRRLHRVAGRLVPKPAIMPYYLCRSQSRAEPAPGWYMQRGEDDAPIYLGHGAVDAELELRDLLARQEGEHPAAQIGGRR